MLVAVLAVVHARVPLLVRVLVPGLVVGPAHVLGQGESDFREVGITLAVMVPSFGSDCNLETTYPF